MQAPFSLNKITLGMLLASAILSPLSAAELTASSKIDAVTVFPGSAKVSRVATIQVPAGESTLEIKDLPINLVNTSLRVNGESDTNISLGSVSLKREVNKDVVLKNELDIRNKIEVLSEQRKGLEDTINRAKAQLQYINAMGSGNASKNGSSYLQLPMEKWQEAWQTLGAATEKAQSDIRQTELQLKQLDVEITKLQTELRGVASNQKSTRVATLTINAEQAGELSVQVSYIINGAGWSPVYDADLNTETGNLSIKTQAEIFQRTGEDWINTNVTLSTLRPSQSSQLIELQSWSIDFMDDRLMKSRGMAMNSMAMSADVMEESAPIAMMKPAPRVARKRVQTEQSTLVFADFSADYKVPSLVSLDSGNQKRRFLLSTSDFDSSIVLASTPRLDPRVLLTTSFTYNSPTPLLAGTASLYRDGNFVGSSRLSQKQAGEKVQLSFGEDDKVKLTFQPNPDSKSNDGVFFGKRKVVDRGYQITLNNQHDKAYPLHIFDNVPVASHDDIKVTLTGDAPTDKDIDDKKGVLRWERSLKGNSETRIKYGYTVTYPEDKSVLGL
ncbi:mucoidy inhibitor MuiA family protein [Leucothrix arctica]|uniref:Mucoidy inhibitor MuiA family protein n=1 Tax=Leucothrix arctica TaxID=1481894 RepID=A0A317CG24_9GAMM|nr:mucoidy inhibitor MuiA family protein [Leucothrix arctica]PWQ96363.1 hypothetical protein DKT75_10285 [Leucothrix arctica]